MKILIYATSLGGGGAQKTLRLLSYGMVSNGHDVTFVHNSECNNSYSMKSIDGVSYIELDSYRTKNSLFRLRKIIKTINPDICLTTQAHTCILLSFAHLMANSNSTLILRECTLLRSEDMSYFIRYLYIFVLKRFANKIVALSDQAKEDLISYGVYKDKITIINNPIDCEFLDYDAAKDFSFSDDYFDKIRFIFVGRIVRQKGLVEFLLDLPILVNNKIDFTVDIYGSGDLELECRRIVSSKNLKNMVNFHGWKDNPYDNICEGSVLIVPSLWEGYGHVYTEASCIGLPIITKKSPGGSNDIVKKYNIGHVYDDLYDLSIFLSNKNRLSNNFNNYVKNAFQYIEKLDPILISEKYTKL